MKKTIILSMCCMSALTASASSGPDEVTLGILSFIFMVFGVLQIILFFKVWGMCNNVKRMTKMMEDKIERQNDQVKSEPRPKNQPEKTVNVINPWK